jgi:hypothetical protein
VKVEDLCVRRYVVHVLVPKEPASQESATMEGWFARDYERALAVDVTSMGPSPEAIVCAAGRHVIEGPTPGDGREVEECAELCEFCGDEVVAAGERRAEGDR